MPPQRLPRPGRAPSPHDKPWDHPSQPVPAAVPPAAVASPPLPIHAPKLPAPVWIGSDVLKVLAGPALTKFVFLPNTLSQVVGPNPRRGSFNVGSSSSGPEFISPAAVASSQTSNSDGTAGASPRTAAEPGSTVHCASVQAFELRATELLQSRQLVAALGELEQALCWVAKEHDQGLDAGSLGPAGVVQYRWQQLVSSAVAWSFDLLADSSLWAPGGECGEISDQALEMLCLAEMLTRPDIASSFQASATPARGFLRSLVHAGLGTYYRLRLKPRVAAQFLEQAADGHARWAHPAVLMNLSAAYTLLRKSDKALGCVNRAVLALRSAAGRLCGESLDDVQKACRAAEHAVRSVLGLDFCTSSVLPAQAPSHAQGGSGEDGPPVMTARMDNIEVAVAHTVLFNKVLLWPWPEFREEEAVASSAFNSVTESSEDESVQASPENVMHKLAVQLKSQAAAGIARHAAQLKSSWPLWGQPVTLLDAPGAGLVLRECVLLCFLQVVAILRQCCPRSRYNTWITPLVQEGLGLAIVLFGPKHPLAHKLIKAYHKAQWAAQDTAKLHAVLQEVPASPLGVARGTRANVVSSDMNLAVDGRPSSPEPKARGRQKAQPFIVKVVSNYIAVRKDSPFPDVRMHTARIEETVDALRATEQSHAEGVAGSKAAAVLPHLPPADRPNAPSAAKGGKQKSAPLYVADCDNGANPMAGPAFGAGRLKKRPQSATSSRPISAVAERKAGMPPRPKSRGVPVCHRTDGGPSQDHAEHGDVVPGYRYHLSRGYNRVWVPEPVLTNGL